MKKTFQRDQVSSSVDSILVPALLRAYNMAGKPPPITSARNSDFPGRMTGVTLLLPHGYNKNWTITTRGANIQSIYYFPPYTTPWNTMNRSDSMRN